MEISRLVLAYLQTLVWPSVAVAILVRYHKTIESLASRSKITFQMAGFSIETTLERLERTIEENLRGHRLTADQWAWMRRLRDEGRIPYNHKADYDTLRPLRNAGLIREFPEKWLTTAEAVEITALGTLLLEAFERQSRP